MPLSLIDVYYRNARGLRTKNVECFHSAIDHGSDVLCLIEKRRSCDQVYRIPRILKNVALPSGLTVVARKQVQRGTLITVRSHFTCKRRPDLELVPECVQVGLILRGTGRILTGRHEDEA